VLSLDRPLHEEGMPVERERAAVCTMSCAGYVRRVTHGEIADRIG
jgi:hypothetical protein